MIPKKPMCFMTKENRLPWLWEWTAATACCRRLGKMSSNSTNARRALRGQSVLPGANGLRVSGKNDKRILLPALLEVCGCGDEWNHPHDDFPSVITCEKVPCASQASQSLSSGQPLQNYFLLGSSVGLT